MKVTSPATKFEETLAEYVYERSEEARAVRVGEKDSSEQAAIVARYAEIFSREMLELLTDRLGRYRVHRGDATGVLGNHRRDHVRAINAKGGKCLEIALQTGTSRGVGASDGQYITQASVGRS